MKVISGAAFLGEGLIFIISQPRAGSTLLQRILAGNPQVQTSAEPWVMLHPVYALRKQGIQTDYKAERAFEALQDYLTHYAGGEETYFSAIRAFAEVLYQSALQRAGKKIFLDKTPRYYQILPELYRLFPQAKFILLMRNPLAVFFSILQAWVGGEWHFMHRFRDDLLLAPRKLVAGSSRPETITLRYEDLVTRPEETVSQLCQQLGLAFDLRMLKYGDRQAPAGSLGDSTGIQRHQAPSTGSLDQWQRLAENEQTRRFALDYLEALSAPLVGAMGYDFAALQQAMHPEISFNQEASIPLELALRPEATWSRREWLVYMRTVLVQQQGWRRGNWIFYRQHLFEVLRAWISNEGR